MKPVKKKKNYINNKTAKEEFIKYRELLNQCVSAGKPKPKISPYIGQCIILICNNLAKRPNFSGYSFIQDMIDDGIIDCTAAVDNYDPTSTFTPFAYFTKVAWNAFVRRIFKEKKQNYIKHKNYEYASVLVGTNSIYDNNTFKRDPLTDEMIRDFENSLTKTKKPAIIGLEKFIGEPTSVE
jgi:hypothetical protein